MVNKELERHIGESILNFPNIENECVNVIIATLRAKADDLENKSFEADRILSKPKN